MALTAEVLERLGTPKDKARQYVPLLDVSMREFGITTPVRARMFLAQLAHESIGLTHFEELASGAKYEGNTNLGNTHPGDGVRFKGRGPIQLTGRWNYMHYGNMIGVDLIKNPQLAAQPRYGFRLAAAYFEDRGCNRAADRGDFHECTRLINAAQLGYDARFAYYQRLQNVDPVPGAGYLKRGDHGDGVRTLTRRLSFVRSKATGKPYLGGKRLRFDAETEQALRAFQQEHGLTADGSFGLRSAKKLARATEREKQRRKGVVPPVPAPVPAASGAKPSARPAAKPAAGPAARPAVKPLAHDAPAALPALVQLLERREAATDRAWDAIVAHGRRRGARLAELAGPGGFGSDARGRAEAAEFELLNATLKRIEEKLGTLVEIEQREAAAAIAEAGHVAETAAPVTNGAPESAPADAAAATIAGPATVMATAPSSMAAPAAPAATAAATAPAATAAAMPTAPPPPKRATDEELLERIEQLDRALHRTRRRLISRYATVDKELARIAPPAPPRPRPTPSGATVTRPAADEPKVATTPKGPKAQPKTTVRALQEALNAFTSQHLHNVTPLIVDGVQGAATRQRIRKAKYWLGYNGPERRKLAADPDFLKRLRRPKAANPAMAARGLKRRRQQRVLAKKAAAPRAGVMKFEGKDVAAWIEPHLRWAKAHGWTGTIESGYRTPEYSEHICFTKCGRPSCDGNCAGRTSNHSGRIAPHGAVDVTDYPRFAELMKRSPHRPQLHNALGAADPNHFSATGH